MASERHDLELRDVRDGQLVVTHNRVRHGHSSTRASHVSDRLPLACLALFDGPTVDVADLTAEERAWVEAAGERIEFGSETERQPPKQRVVTDGGEDVDDVYLEVDADGEGGTPGAMAHVLRSHAEALEDAPEDRRYDFELTIEERTVGDASDTDVDRGDGLRPDGGEPAAPDTIRVLDASKRIGAASDRGCNIAVEYLVEDEPGTEMEWLDDFLDEHAGGVEVADDGLRADGGPSIGDEVAESLHGEHPGDVDPGPDHTLEFADEYVDAIRAGAKTATVRYGTDGAGIERGDVVAFVDEAGERFLTVEITHTAQCYAIEAWPTIQVWDATYGADSPSETVSGVNQHYDAPIRPLTDVRVLAWRAPEVDDA